MKPARIIILVVAIVTAGMAALLAMGLTAPTIETADENAVIQQQPTTMILVASGSLPVGSHLTDATMKWIEWPKTAISEGFITQDARPNAMTELAGVIVRMPIFDGEPVRQEKIADASSQIMSSLLPSGKRAVATDITVSTSAGGFILPNDRVDVLMVRKAEGRDSNYKSEVVLSNIRVLAIDQIIQKKEGEEASVVGATATLELSADQARVIAIAQQMASKLTLVLRSVADAQEPDSGVPDHILTTGSTDAGITVIKSGAIINAAPTQ
ncbi:MAG: Flp pilus assembly protein CpaB [Pseudomonadota bacterium]